MMMIMMMKDVGDKKIKLCWLCLHDHDVDDSVLEELCNVKKNKVIT